MNQKAKDQAIFKTDFWDILSPDFFFSGFWAPMFKIYSIVVSDRCLYLGFFPKVISIKIQTKTSTVMRV